MSQLPPFLSGSRHSFKISEAAGKIQSSSNLQGKYNSCIISLNYFFCSITIVPSLTAAKKACKLHRGRAEKHHQELLDGWLIAQKLCWSPVSLAKACAPLPHAKPFRKAVEKEGLPLGCWIWKHFSASQGYGRYFSLVFSPFCFFPNQIAYYFKIFYFEVAAWALFVYLTLTSSA